MGSIGFPCGFWLCIVLKNYPKIDPIKNRLSHSMPFLVLVIKKVQICSNVHIFVQMCIFFSATNIIGEEPLCIQSTSQQQHLIMNKETNKVEKYHLCLWISNSNTQQYYSICWPLDRSTYSILS